MSEQEFSQVPATFASAAEMQSLSAEARADSLETEPLLNVIVERRRAGNTELVGVLSTHAIEHAEEIIHALSRCDVLALEQVGIVDEAGRRATEKLYAELLAVAPSDDRIDRAAAQAKSHNEQEKSKLNLNNRDKPSLVVEILKRFRGTGKRVALLDVTEDNDELNHDKLDEIRGLLLRSEQVVLDLAPVDVARTAIAATIAGLAETYEVRDRVLTQQLQELASGLNQSKGRETAGAMIGMMHYRAIMATGESVDPAATEANNTALRRTFSLLEQAIETTRVDGGVSDTVIDRVLLATYLRTPTISTLDRQGADAVAQKFDDEQVSRILAAIDDYTVRPAGTSSFDTAEQLRPFLKAVIGIAQH